MRLTVVGSAPAYTRRPSNSSSCYLVQDGRTALVLDLGQGSFAALAGLIDPREIEAIFVSHSHPDHHIDLVPLRHYLRYASDPPGRVDLHAPPGLRTRYDSLLGEEDFLGSLEGEDLVRGVQTVGSVQVETAPVTHIENSFAFRISAADRDAPGIVYSGDCGVADDLRSLIRPRDVLLCEASWGASGPRDPGAALHLSAADAAQLAQITGVSRLVLTHVLDEFNPAAALRIAARTFTGPTALAEPGMVLA